MRRKVIMTLLAFGVVGGYGSSLAHLMCRHRHHRDGHRQLMQQIAHTCLEAARAGAPAVPPSARP